MYLHFLALLDRATHLRMIDQNENVQKLLVNGKTKRQLFEQKIKLLVRRSNAG